MTKTTLKFVLFSSVVATFWYGGWVTRGWFENSRELAIVESQRVQTDRFQKNSAVIAQGVERQLSQLRAKQTVVGYGVIREVHKPIYKRVCVEPELVSLLNDALRGNGGDTSPAEPAGEVSPGSRAVGEW